MRYLILICCLISANIGLSQITTFPFNESFESTFIQGDDIEFTNNWFGNKVAKSNRIFQGSQSRSGSTSINIIPTSSFTAEVFVHLDLTNTSNLSIEFYAFSRQNGSSTSSRPALLSFATSIDNGNTYLDNTPIGDHLTFPNNDQTSYGLHRYDLSPLANMQPEVVVKIMIKRGSGSGSAAELVMDDFKFLINENPVAPPEPIAFREIIINEIFADPTGDSPPNPQLLPKRSSKEFIELYNPSERAVDISNFDLSGGTISSFQLESESYVILTSTSNVEDFQVFGDVIAVSSWNTLSNNGEKITLTDHLGNLIDSLTFSKSWYRDDAKADGAWSLELINPEAACSDEGNWTASTSEIGGTPGTINAVYDNTVDTSPPEVLDVSVIDPSNIMVVFNEPMELALLTSNNFQISDEIGITELETLDSFGKKLILHLDGNLTSGLIYELTIESLADCSGNQIATATHEFFIGAIPERHKLIITEIMAQPIDDGELPNVEYLELLNTSDEVLSLQGLILSDAKDSTVLSRATLMPDSYLLLAPASDAHLLNDFDNVLPVTNWPSLNAAEDHISLSLNGIVIHEVPYSNEWYRSDVKSNGGFSLEMIDVNYPCYEELNWASSEHRDGGTPGKSNSISEPNPDLIGPSLISATAKTQNQLKLIFDEKLDVANLSKDQITIQPQLQIHQLNVDSRKREILLTTDSLEENSIYQISVDNISDCSGNLILDGGKSAELIVPIKADPLDIIINEVLFNPKSGGVRFVELYNNSDKYVDLKSWILAGKTNESIISMETALIRPRSYLVLTDDVNTLKDHYPKTILDRTMELPKMPSMNSKEGSVSIINAAGIVIDFMLYSEDNHSPLLDDYDGVSLERIRPDASSIDANNWTSASSTENFTTPGYLNSQFQQLERVDETVSIEPKTFSPWSPGRSFTTINFKFDNPGNVLSVGIYDVRGGLVHQLVSNQLVGTEGFFRWDGTNLRGSMVRVGYYLILFQIIPPSGKARILKEKVAVGSDF